MANPAITNTLMGQPAYRGAAPSPGMQAQTDVTQSVVQKTPTVVSRSNLAQKQIGRMRSDMNQSVADMKAQQARNEAAKRQLQQEAQQIAQTGFAAGTAPAPQGQLAPTPSLPQGFVSDVSGQIFKAPTTTVANQAAAASVTPERTPTGGTEPAAPEVPPVEPVAPTPTPSVPPTATAPAAPAPTPDTFATEQELGKLTGDVVSAYNQMLQGTMPLTTTQQAQLDATRAAFNDVVQQTRDANEKYVAAVKARDIRTGLMRSDPRLFAGNIRQAYFDTARNIASIDAKQALAVAQMQQGFMDDNMKLVKEKFDVLNQARKEKQTQIDKLREETQAQANKMLEYNRQLEKDARQAKMDELTFGLASDKFTYQQAQDKIDNAFRDRQITETERNNLRDYAIKRAQITKDNYVLSPDGVPFNKTTGRFEPDRMPKIPGTNSGLPNSNAYLDAFTNASISLGGTKEDKAAFKRSIESSLAENNVAGAKDKITRAAIASLPAASQTAAIDRTTALDAFNAIKTMLQAYRAKGGDTGLLTGNLQQVKNKFGQTGDPELVKLGAEMNSVLQKYRNSVTGAAWGAQESAEYRSLMPTITDAGTLNVAKVDQMIDIMNRAQRSAIGSQIGTNNYDTIFGKESTPDVFVQYQTPEAFAQAHPSFTLKNGQTVTFDAFRKAFQSEHPNASKDDFYDTLKDKIDPTGL